MIEVVDDPRFPDRIGVGDGPGIPCKVTEFSAALAVTGAPHARPGYNAVYDQVRQYRIRYELPPAPTEPVHRADVLDAVRVKIEHPPTVTAETAGESAVRINHWASAARAALLAVLERHKATYYDGRPEYEHHEEPVFSADGTPRGTIEVRGKQLPPDWCEPCGEVVPCSEMREIAEALGIGVSDA